MVLTDWTQLYELYYVAHVERGLTGMTFFETFPQEGVTTLAASLRAIVDANLGTRPIYTTLNSPELRRYYRLDRVDGPLILYRLEQLR